jgi:TRAP-type transport system periplasmic protein
MRMTRRGFLRATAASTGIGAFAILTKRSDAAEFTWRYGNDMVPTHSMNVRLQQAVQRIRQESGGRIDIQIFPNNQLGGDTDMLSQLRTGVIQLFNLSGLILATVVPVASINGIGFGLKD